MKVIEYNSSWPLAEFKDVAEVVTGSTPSTKKPEYHGGDIPFVKPGDLKEEGIVVNDAENHVTELGAEQGRLIPINSVMICCIGSLGKVGFSKKPLITNQQINSLVFDESKVYPKYGYYYCTTIQPILEHIAPNTTVAIVNKTNFSKLKIPLPPLETQKKIVAVLDKADALRQKRRLTIDKLFELSQSMFLDMFGDPHHNQKNFPIGTIRDLVSATKYGTNKKAHEEKGEYPVIRMGNLTYAGEWDFSNLKYVDLDDNELEKYFVYEGDVLFNRTNSKELVGKTGVYRREEPMAYAGYLIRVRTNDKANSEFLSGFLNSQYAKRKLEHMCKNIVGMANINAQELLDIEIMIPPLDLQEKFKEKILNVRKLRKKLQNSCISLDFLFNSILKMSFSGEFNLISKR